MNKRLLGLKYTLVGVIIEEIGRFVPRY